MGEYTSEKTPKRIKIQVLAAGAIAIIGAVWMLLGPIHQLFNGFPPGGNSREPIGIPTFAIVLIGIGVGWLLTIAAVRAMQNYWRNG